MACVPPAPLLCTAFWVWTDQPLCSVMPHSPGEQANEGVIGGRRRSSSMRERERRRSATSFAAPVCLFSSELKINSKTGAGDCSQSWFHLFYSCCWLTCDIGACSLEHGKVQCLRKGQAALHSYPHPPSSLSTVICSFLWMLIFSDLHIFDLNHSRLALFPFYFRLSLPLTIHISFFFFCHVGGCLVQKRVNREPSSDIEEPNCVECTCGSRAAHSRGHTEFMSPTARAILTPGTLLS